MIRTRQEAELLESGMSLVGAAEAAISPSIRGLRRYYKGKSARQCAIHDFMRIRKSEDMTINPGSRTT